MATYDNLNRKTVLQNIPHNDSGGRICTLTFMKIPVIHNNGKHGYKCIENVCFVAICD